MSTSLERTLVRHRDQPVNFLFGFPTYGRQGVKGALRSDWPSLALPFVACANAAASEPETASGSPVVQSPAPASKFI